MKTVYDENISNVNFYSQYSLITCFSARENLDEPDQVFLFFLCHMCFFLKCVFKRQKLEACSQVDRFSRKVVSLQGILVLYQPPTSPTPNPIIFGIGHI